MSLLLDRLNLFASRSSGKFSDGHGVTTREDRAWEDAYRQRWQHDEFVHSTHRVNCARSCSWKVYVKGGTVTWETQQTDYPRTQPDLPNHKPRGCSRGASYSCYFYSGNRVKYPLVRPRLVKLWRKVRATPAPAAAWASIVEDPVKRAAYTKKCRHGGFVRAEWDAVTEIIAALGKSLSDFGDFARQHSDCSSGKEEGRYHGQTTPKFETFLFALEEGQLCPKPVKTSYGVHVIRLDNRESGRVMPFEAVRSRIATYFEEVSWRRTVSQYVQLLAGQSKVQEFDLAGAADPLVQ